MRNNTKIIFVSLFTVLSVSVFGIVLSRALWYLPEEEQGIVSGVIPQLALAEGGSNGLPLYPFRIKIPKIKIDAKIKYVGITKAGNMGTPGNFQEVGWYKYGTVPGEKGSAVLSGHVDNGLKMPGVFKNLGKLEKGDEVYVERVGGGEPLRFIVTGKEIYDYDARVEEIFNNEGDDSILRLITCTGTWMPQYRTRDKRLVVTAIKAE